MPCQPKDELAKAPLLIAKLRELASKAGGMAPAPELPKLTAIEALEAQSGNAQLLELFNRYDELTAIAKQWVKTADDIKKRHPVWSELINLLEHAKELGPYAELKADADAVRDNRTLLADPDPVRPLLDRASDVLRLALNAKLQGFQNTFAHQQAQLSGDSDWAKLSAAQSGQLTAAHHLEPVKVPDLATPAQLQDALDDCNLQHWISKTQALSSKFESARHAAVTLLKPNVVHVPLPKRTLNNEAELKVWLNEVEQLLAEKLKIGPVAL
ncbi:hypothetical protein RA876_09190 [Rhodoferax antarcticus]|nr:hypothetical protein RA876_09190 [Rhodoferax antarcticus]